MNLFALIDLIPGNDPVSKVVNGACIVVIVAVSCIYFYTMEAYCTITGTCSWTNRA